jgi:hypothetical protein
MSLFNDILYLFVLGPIMLFKQFTSLVMIISGCISAHSHAQAPAANHVLTDSLNNNRQTLEMGKTSQKRVDRFVSETDLLLNEYQSLLKKSEYQAAYNKELRILKGEQVEELISLEQQIKDIVITKQQLLPLLREMVSTLSQFIKLDLPFKQQQRLIAIDKLNQVLASSSVSISEKYRRVMEMYQAENDYNYDLEVYRDTVELNNESLSVQILRVGRSHLYFQTMDGKISAMWNQESKAWLLLDHAYHLKIRKAMRIASKKSAPELLELPYSTELSAVSMIRKGGK